jgi:hypothetical protein
MTDVTKNVPQVHKGSVWNYDQATGIVVLQCEASSGLPGDSNIVVLRTSNIAARSHI